MRPVSKVSYNTRWLIIINSYFLVGTSALSELVKSMQSIRKRLHPLIDEFNLNNPDSPAMNEKQLTTIIIHDGMGEDLSADVSFWKAIEQVHLSKSCLERLIRNCEVLSQVDCSDIKYDSLRDCFIEFMSRKSRKFYFLKLEAQSLLNQLVNEMFSNEIMDKLNEVSKFV